MTGKQTGGGSDRRTEILISEYDRLYVTNVAHKGSSYINKLNKNLRQKTHSHEHGLHVMYSQAASMSARVLLTC